jgi:hypothetical protein
LVARFVRDEEVAGSNPVTPTSGLPSQQRVAAARADRGTGRFAVGFAWVGGVVEPAGRQSDVVGAVVAVASVVPVSPLVSMARRVSTANRGLLL